MSGSEHGRALCDQERKARAQDAQSPAAQRMAGAGGMVGYLLRLQRTIGNHAVGQLLRQYQTQSARHSRAIVGAIPTAVPFEAVQRQPESEAEGGTSALDSDEPELMPAEEETFEAVMNELSDEDLDAAAEEEEAEEAESEAASPEETPVQTTRDVAMLSVQRVKSLSSATNPDHTLATALEGHTGRSGLPRLVTLKRWKQIKRKHALLGYRKYAAIRHQNLQDNVTPEDLVLLLRLKRRAKMGKKRDLHYAAIEAKANKKNQTAQHRTELLGEAVTAIRMEGYGGGDCKLLVGYASGAGIDQLWVSAAKKRYYVVEAKGPGATLRVDRFAVRGVANGAGMTQMSQQWVADRIPRIKTQYPGTLAQLLNDCALKVNASGLLENDTTKVATHVLEGLVLTAKWDANDDAQSSLSKRTYNF